MDVKWSKLTPEAIEELLMTFEASPLTLSAFAVKNEFSAAGFAKVAKALFRDRWAAVMARKKRKTTPYSRGAGFEYRIMHELEREGYSLMRSSGSHGLVDIYAFKKGSHLYIQAKTNGVLPPAERDGLIALAQSNSAVPVLAERSDGRTLRYWTFAPGKVPYVVSPKNKLFRSPQ